MCYLFQLAYNLRSMYFRFFEKVKLNYEIF